MLGLVAGKAAAHAVAVLLTSTVLVHGGQPYSPQPYTRWLEGLLVPGPPGYVDFGIGPCPGSDELGCMDWVFPVARVRMERSDRLDKLTFAHELGHVFDFYVLRQIGWRDRFAALEGFPWTTPRSEEYFADSYALCALRARLSRPVTTGYGFRVTPALHTRICSLIRRAFSQWQVLAPVGAPGQSLVASAAEPPGGGVGRR